MSVATSCTAVTTTSEDALNSCWAHRTEMNKEESSDHASSFSGDRAPPSTSSASVAVSSWQRSNYHVMESVNHIEQQQEGATVSHDRHEELPVAATLIPLESAESGEHYESTLPAGADEARLASHRHARSLSPWGAPELPNLLNSTQEVCTSATNETMLTTSSEATAHSLKTTLSDKRIQKHQRRLERQQSRLKTRTYWDALPIDLLERIFSLLTIKERHIASQVCPHWFECFYLPGIWANFTVNDLTFTKRKFNYYLGYQQIIDPFKTQLFLQRFGHHVRCLTIKPMSNFFNLYEFMKILSGFAQHYETNPLKYLHTFEFTFGCKFSNPSLDEGVDERGRRLSIGEFQQEESVLGTGGKLLEALTELMSQLVGLKHLALRDLLLQPHEAQHFLDCVAINCCEKLLSLTLINCSLRSYAFLHTGVFLRLETLIISSQHLSEDVLTLLAHNQSLLHMYIVQNEFTRIHTVIPASTWRRFCDINQKIQIHLAQVDNTLQCLRHDFVSDSEMVHQETRVVSIIYDTPYVQPTKARLMEVTKLYADSLECIAFFHLPKYPIHKSYADRADTLLIYLSGKCGKLRTLIISDLISTATLLLVATHASQLTRLLVRRNAIRKRFDCGIHPQWSDSFIRWLRQTSRSYEATFGEVSRMLGYSWLPLTDEQFKRIRPDVNL